MDTYRGNLSLFASSHQVFTRPPSVRSSTVFAARPQSPFLQLLNEALEPLSPIGSEDNLLQTTNEEVTNNGANSIYTQELAQNTAEVQNTAEEEVTSIQCTDNLSSVGNLSSVDALIRDVDPYSCSMPPKIYQKLIDSVMCDTYPPFPRNDNSACIDDTRTEGLSQENQGVTTENVPHDEKMQLYTPSDNNSPSLTSPDIQKRCTAAGNQPSTSSAQCSEAEQWPDGSVVLNSHSSPTSNWYGASTQGVPEPVQSVENLPEGGLVHSSLLISAKEAGMGNDHETPQLPTSLASQSFGNSLPGAISHHQQFGHQLSHHEPPREHRCRQCELLEKQLNTKGKQIQELQELVRKLQGGRHVAAMNEISWFTKEQKREVEIILDDSSITWTDALGKILVIVFGKEVLSQSCGVGKKNTSNKPLNAEKLNAIKRLIVDVYGSINRMNRIFNEVVNRMCSSARRSLKLKK